MSGLGPLTLSQLGVLLALAFGLLLWLHLRAPRPVQKRVPYLGAWDEVAPAGTPRPAKWALARSWALVRALAIVGLLGVALADPQPYWLAGEVRTTLIVLDAGAHMRVTDESPSRFERARTLAEAAAAASVRSGEVMIVQLDAGVTPLSGWERQPAPLAAALRAAAVSPVATQFSALVAFAREHLRGKPSPELIVATDGAFDVTEAELESLRDAGITVSQLRVGSSSKNLAIRQFAMRAYPWDAERCEAMLELENTDDAPRAVELTLIEDGRPIDLKPLQLPAKSTTTHFFALGASGTRFEARIAAQDGAKDAQPIDDEAYAIVPQRRSRRVLLVSDGQRYLESALALDPKLQVLEQKPGEYRSAEGFDVAIFDRFVPSSAPAVPVLWIAPGDGGPIRIKGSIERPFFDEVQVEEPLLKSLSLRDVNIRRAHRVELEPGDEVLARAKQGPLIVQGQRSGQPFLALTFDARETDLVLRTAWPVFVAKAIQQLTAAGDPAFEPSLKVGETRQFDLRYTPAVVHGPHGERTTLQARNGTAAFTPSRPGFYELSTPTTKHPFAVSPNAEATAHIEPRTFAPAPTHPRPLASAIPAHDLVWWTSLALALALLALDAWLAGKPSDLRGWIAASLRAGSFGCLVFALCRPELQRQSSRVHLVVAADVSKSVRDESLRFAGERVAELRLAFEQRNQRAARRDRGLLDVVAFAGDARPIASAAGSLERLPVADNGDDPGLASDLQGALRAAYGRLAPDYVHNVLLVTDGNETLGNVLAEAARAARLGIRVDVLSAPVAAIPDVAIRSLTSPRDLAAGVPFTLRAELTADRPAHVRASLYAAAEPAQLETTRELELPAGSTTLQFPLTAKAPGRIEYRLELQPTAADRRPENNQAAVAVEVPGPPRVLIVDSEPTAAAPLAHALRTRDFDVDVKAPSAVPRHDSDYANYAFVILSDVASRDLHPEAAGALARYVQEFGGGLLASGGTRSFGLGADRSNALDALLPVRAAAEEQRDQASLALALIIDCSGSMAGGKLDLAREAAALTAQTLADPDLIEVIGFSSQPERRVRLQPASNRASIAQSIARLAATGGTQLYPALDAAYRDLRGAQARLKHAILLTDGQTQEAGIEDLASSMRADGITLSTVGLGTEVNRGLLETVAGLGGGRAYFPLDAQTIPQIFMSEASRQKRPSAVDRSTRAFEREHAGFLEGITLGGAPTLAGYVTTQAKPQPAQVILETDRGEPLLVRWRVGLGYALAWTSDLKPRWASNFLRWPSFARFTAQLVREHMRAPELREAPVQARVERDQLHVIADALGGSEQFENGLEAKVRVLSHAGEVSNALLGQTGPGRYETRLPWIQTGAFTVDVSFHRAGALQALGHARFATAFPAELEAEGPDTARLAQVAASTGGRQLTTAAEALDAGTRRVTLREACWPVLAWLALGLFLLDQCVRHARLLGRTPPPHRTAG